MNAEPIEQQEEQRSPRPKPVVVKPRPRETGVRLIGCQAYPATGYLAGATVEWCRRNRGRMAACEKCKWRKT